MSNGLVYTEAGSVESFGGHSMGVKVSIALDRDLTLGDERVIQKAIDDIRKALIIQSDMLDPKVQDQIATERKEIEALFDQHIYVKEIPNGYGERPLFPWFEITTRQGIIVIGWRRRVISIDWSKSDIKATTDDLFRKEDVTKERRLIHAWSYEKAKEYLGKILQ